jgi:ParB/RepB/Spo0J family partition protein
MLARAEHSDYAYPQLLARVKAALASSREVAVPARDVRPFPDQPRKFFDEAAIRRLSESIDASGQTTAGIIRVSRDATSAYELIDGERRWRAVLLIPEDRRPDYRARLVDADDDVVQYLISGIANFNREGHAPLETSDTICRLCELGLPLREVAALLGLSEVYSGQLRGLRKLSAAVRGLMDPELPSRQRLPTTAAIEISKVPDAELQWQLAQRVIARDVSLGVLRTEVVRTARKANVAVRQKAVSPHHRWGSIRNKVGVVRRAAADMADALGSEGVRAHIARRSPAEVRDLAGALDSAIAQLEGIRSALGGDTPTRTARY